MKETADTRNKCTADCDKSVNGYCTSETGGCGALPPQAEERKDMVNKPAHYQGEIEVIDYIRHELIHAFMDESGFGDCFEHKDFGQEETVVDWFAYQMPKITKLADDICKAVIWGDEECTDYTGSDSLHTERKRMYSWTIRKSGDVLLRTLIIRLMRYLLSALN